MLAPWIISHFPAHRIYVEPFGGGGSVLLRKSRSYAEVYNDLDDEIVNLFLMARDRGEELRERLRLTPFARSEFLLSYHRADDVMERARRTVVRAYMGFGSAAVSGEISGFRATSYRAGWANFPDALVHIVDRLQGVVIENRDALHVLQQHDKQDTLHYVDPPYVHSTRSGKTRGTSSRKSYRHELSDAQHAALADTLRRLDGMVVISGYPSPLYDDLYGDWQRVERAAMADGARRRVEVLWLSPNVTLRQQRMFE